MIGVCWCYLSSSEYNSQSQVLFDDWDPASLVKIWNSQHSEIIDFMCMYLFQGFVCFRFIVVRPALEVKFLLKTKLNSSATAKDLLLVMLQALQQSGRSLFRDFTVDLASLKIEGQGV